MRNKGNTLKTIVFFVLLLLLVLVPVGAQDQSGDQTQPDCDVLTDVSVDYSNYQYYNGVNLILNVLYTIGSNEQIAEYSAIQKKSAIYQINMLTARGCHQAAIDMVDELVMANPDFDSPYSIASYLKGQALWALDPGGQDALDVLSAYYRTDEEGVRLIMFGEPADDAERVEIVESQVNEFAKSVLALQAFKGNADLLKEYVTPAQMPLAAGSLLMVERIDFYRTSAESAPSAELRNHYNWLADAVEALAAGQSLPVYPDYEVFPIGVGPSDMVNLYDFMTMSNNQRVITPDAELVAAWLEEYIKAVEAKWPYVEEDAS